VALYYELPIYQETYHLLLELFKLTQNFSREYKYTIGQDIKYNGIQMVQYIFKANSATDKAETLSQLSDEIELLKLELRLCIDMHLISPEQQARTWESIESISKQISGWKKAVVQNHR
jgi:hypothetical protein